MEQPAVGPSGAEAAAEAPAPEATEPVPAGETGVDATALKIAAAMPMQAPAEPLRNRRLLVFSLCQGFKHGAIPTCETAIRIMGEKTGAFETVITDEMAAFDPELLATFDAVLLNNTTRLKFEDPKRRQALLDFVRGGKGLIGIHAATDNFYDWPEAAAVMGGLFDGHPWGAGGTWAFKIDEPDHPLTRSFGGQGFLLSDEIYQFKGPYSRDGLRVLVSLDMSNSRNTQVSGIKRNDGDFAVSWIHREGKGRVFYCSLGHNEPVYWNPAVLDHYLAGIQYALGDLRADDAPSAAVGVRSKPARTTDAGAIDDPIPELREYDFGSSRVPLATVEEMVRAATLEERRIIEKRLLGVLDSPVASFAAKQFVCRMLRRAGTMQSIPALESLLFDEDLSDEARFALQGFDHHEVDAILRRALGELDGALKIGVIGTIAQRGDERAVPLIAGFIGSGDEALARAAISALGTIGGSAAADALQQSEPAPGLESLRDDACLLCADRLLERGARADALAIYDGLSTPLNAPMTRIAAYKGLVNAERDRALPVVLAMLFDGEEKVRRAAGRLVCEKPSIDVRALADEIPSLEPDAQALILAALASRGDRAAAPVAAEACASGHEEVRLAALNALGALGGPAHVELLARTAATGDAAGKAAARSLRRLGGSGVDTAILECLHQSEAGVRCALIRSLAPRRFHEAVPVLFIYARDEDGAVRGAALEALETLASENDLFDLVQLLSTAGDDDLEGVKKAILAACKRIEESEERTGFLLESLAGKEGRVRAALLAVLGKLPCEKSMDALLAALEDEDGGVRLAAVRGLASWPDAAPLMPLLAFANGKAAEEERAIAFEGSVRMAGLPGGPESAPPDVFDALSAAARTREEKERVLEGAAEVADTWVLNFLERYLKDEALRAAAEEARARVVDKLVKKVGHDAKGCEVTLVNPVADRYSGGGKNALTDGVWGTTDHGDGRWQGFEGKDLDATVDLGSTIAVQSIRAGFLQNNNSWVFFPSEVEFALSVDGSEFEVVETVQIPVPTKMQPAETRVLLASPGGREARFVRVRARNIGVLPDWHPGNGGPAWLFADEIQVNPHLE
jgi:type 1 glutamine amidotransferase/HEAT repeat protein